MLIAEDKADLIQWTWITQKPNRCLSLLVQLGELVSGECLQLFGSFC